MNHCYDRSNKLSPCHIVIYDTLCYWASYETTVLTDQYQAFHDHFGETWSKIIKTLVM